MKVFFIIMFSYTVMAGKHFLVETEDEVHFTFIDFSMMDFLLHLIAQFALYLFYPQDHEIPAEENEYSFPVETKGAKVFSSQFPWCSSDLVKGNERARGQGSQNKAQFVYNSVNTKNSGEI